MEDNESKIATGFDRGIDFISIKEKLLLKLQALYKKSRSEDSEKQKKIMINQIAYIMIALIQLRNGSRISEAVNAFLEFLKKDDISDKVIVKIAKSDGAKYNRLTKEMIKKKPRYRKLMFPEDWIDLEIFEEIKDSKDRILKIPKDRFRQRVRDYMLKYFNCNTHSLRYAYINHMLYDLKQDMTAIAKFVGHTTVSQLVTYTQNKNTERLFDMKL